MRQPLITLMCGIAALGAAAFAQSQPPSESAAPLPLESSEPVLLELFTSQGCSSCPPADRLAARLAQETGLVVVSRPITYWDRLGWKDTLARAENTTLQRQYARRGLSGRNGVYTPQLVVDGEYGVVGSREREIHQHIAQASSGDTAAIRVRENAEGDWIIGLGGRTDAPAELALLSIASSTDVAIGRGENSGREITYTNVLRDERVIALWEGGSQKVTLSNGALRSSSADRYALVLREPNGGKVLATSWVS